MYSNNNVFRYSNNTFSLKKKTAQHKLIKNDQVMIPSKIIKQNQSNRLCLTVKVGLNIKSLLKFWLSLIFGGTR